MILELRDLKAFSDYLILTLGFLGWQVKACKTGAWAQERMRGHAEIAYLGPRVSDPTRQTPLHGASVMGGIEGNQNAFPFITIVPKEGCPGFLMWKCLQRVSECFGNDFNLDVAYVVPCTKNVALKIAKFDGLWIDQVNLTRNWRSR